MATVRRTGAVDRKAVARELTDDALDVLIWEDAPDVHYPEHAHPSREVRHVLEGAMTVGSSGQTHELGPGDRIELDPGERHWASVGPEGVTYLAGSSASRADSGSPGPS